MAGHAAPTEPCWLCRCRASVWAHGRGVQRSPPLAPASAGKEGKKPLNSSSLTAKGNYLAGFQAEGRQNGEAALNLSREGALDESRGGGKKRISES